MNFQEKISDEIKKLDLRGLSSRQISEKLGIKDKDGAREVGRALDALVKEQKLTKDKTTGKYSTVSAKAKTNAASRGGRDGRKPAPAGGRRRESGGAGNRRGDEPRTAAPEMTTDDDGVLRVKGSVIDVNNNVMTAEGGKTKPIYTGTLRGNKRGFAFLIRDDGGDDLFVPASGLKGAQHGDKAACTIVKGDSAQVECLLERGNARLIGTFIGRKGDDYGFVVPDGNSYFSDIKVRGKDINGAVNNDKVVVVVTDYAKTKLQGKITEVIGNAGDKRSAVLSILKAYEFYDEFGASAIQEAENLKSGVKDGFKGRSDYRDKLTITIDGDDSKDFDDAVTVERDGADYVLYVHIADVSHFVKPNGEIDKEAFNRCTSVYFPGSVYPMLPEVISNDLCSLNEGEDRLTLTCRMRISPSGKVLESSITESVINSDRRMTYNNVTRILDGDEQLKREYSEVVPMLSDMLALKRILEKRRAERGKIDLVSKECKVVLDKDGDVADIVEYPYTESNAIIEEFMLIANETVAEFAVKNELPFVYRVHEAPDKDKVRALSAFLAGFGKMLPPVDVTPSDIQSVLKSLAGEDVEGIVNRVVLRSMQKAKYTTECKGHFGLATEYYCHFTSPIRRYPDLQIHRALKAFINGSAGAKSKAMAAKCAEVAQRSSEREVAAERAERDIDDFYKAEFMSKHIGEEFDGIISGVTSFGVFIELKNTCEGLIKLDGLPADNYTYIEERYCMKGTKFTFALGSRLRIRVADADRVTGRVSFDYVSGGENRR